MRVSDRSRHAPKLYAPDLPGGTGGGCFNGTGFVPEEPDFLSTRGDRGRPARVSHSPGHRARSSARSTSSSEPTTRRPGAGAIAAPPKAPAITLAAAASAARTPVGASSITTHRAGSTPSLAAAAR